MSIDQGSSRQGILLFGPPASGKDSITVALCSLSNRYRLFEKLKIGRGRGIGYRLVDQSVHDKHKIVYSNERYGNVYSVDAETLDHMVSVNQVPVVHMGQMDGVRALRLYPATWHCVLVTCPRPIAMERVIVRATGDVADRMKAWDEIMAQAVPEEFDLVIDTSEISIAEAADLIHRTVNPEEARAQWQR